MVVYIAEIFGHLHICALNLISKSKSLRQAVFVFWLILILIDVERLGITET